MHDETSGVGMKESKLERLARERDRDQAERLIAEKLFGLAGTVTRKPYAENREAAQPVAAADWMAAAEILGTPIACRGGATFRATGNTIHVGSIGQDLKITPSEKPFVAEQKMEFVQDAETSVQSTGAVRSADADSLSFTSMPWVGILAVAKTSQEGASKYGRYNYMRGFSVHGLLEHAMRHLAMYILGDRSEPHLPHCAWNVLTAIQSSVLTPELSEPHMLGPGATITPAMAEHMAEQDPILKAARERGEFKDSGNWKIDDMPEIKTILKQRAERS